MIQQRKNPTSTISRVDVWVMMLVTLAGLLVALSPLSSSFVTVSSFTYTTRLKTTLQDRRGSWGSNTNFRQINGIRKGSNSQSTLKSVADKVSSTLRTSSESQLKTITTKPSSVDVDKKQKDDEELFLWTKQWYPIMPVDLLEQSSSIGGEKNGEIKPKQITVLGRKLVIWNSGSSLNSRDDKQNNNIWTVMEDVCPHRRAPLSTGKVLSCNRNQSTKDEKRNEENSNMEENTIMCRFHGWEFNSSGDCVKIPMQPSSTSSTKDVTKTDVTKATIFPSQVKGGLLWVFMDETVDEKDLPVLSNDSCLPDDNQNIVCNINVFPVSYTSMIENSFDPSHAPFIHEGSTEFGGRMYKPESAIPMTRYGLVNGTKSTKDGFILEHTPYMTDPNKPNNDNTITTRQFIPPCTQITKSTYFGVNLYFVPSTPRETLVITSFPSFQTMTPTKGIKKVLLSTIPKSWKSKFTSIMKDIVHYKIITSTGRRRFSAQDTLTMQGQDYNKGYTTDGSKIVLDVLPTPADNGVSIFQRWIRRYAGGYGPFGSATMTSNNSEMIESSTTVQYQPIQSMWDSHMKHCPICQRSIKRFSAWSALAKKTSTVLTVACATTLLMSSLPIVNQLLNNATSRLSRILYGGLLSAFIMQYVATRLRQEVESVFLSHADAGHPKNDLLLEPYAQ